MTSPSFLARSTFTCLLLALTLALAGCRDGEQQQPAPESEAQKPERTLLIGVIPEQDIFKQKARYQPLVDYLGQKAGVAIKLKILSRYGNIVSSFIEEKLDGAFVGSFTFALLHQKLHIHPLARPVDLNGNSTYYGLIFVRKDSGIRSAMAMKGKRFAFVEKATTAGYLLPLHYFKEEDIADYHSWFSETYFAGTHADAINDVLNNKADAGAAKNTMFERLAKENPRIADELLILTRSPEVPENAFAVRGELDSSLALKLKETLLMMNTTPDGKFVLDRFGAQKFIETKDRDYRTVYQYAEDIGLDLATYDYQNN